MEQESDIRLPAIELTAQEKGIKVKAFFPAEFRRKVYATIAMTITAGMDIKEIFNSLEHEDKSVSRLMPLETKEFIERFNEKKNSKQLGSLLISIFVNSSPFEEVMLKCLDKTYPESPQKTCKILLEAGNLLK